MSTLAKVKKLATKFEATVEDEKDSQYHECRVCAPKGKVWVAGVHEFVDCSNRPWKPDYQDIVDRMNYGLEDCNDPECDWCHSVN